MIIPKELKNTISKSQDTIHPAIKLGLENTNNDSVVQKDWRIDQMIRALTGPDYKKIIRKHARQDYPYIDCGIDQ